MIQRLERTDPTKPLELVTYDADGNEISRKSPTGRQIARIRQREREEGIVTDGVSWAPQERTIGCSLNFPIEWP